MHLDDRLGRPLRALRVSVTDRCNHRCRYCMPREVFGGPEVYLAREELLSFEEITRLVQRFVHLGVRKVRLTGGEPLLRQDLPRLIELLKRIPDLQDLALTTNGVLLEALALDLRRAGLDRITVSLDALDPLRFREITDGSASLERVLNGLKSAQLAGFPAPKLNCVLRRGVNETEILPLAAFARAGGHPLRFIELMDVGTSNGWAFDQVVPAATVRDRLHEHWPLEALESLPGQVAQRWRYLDGLGEVGLIASVSAPFCQGCDRARLSSDGRLFTCLFASEGFDLRSFLRRGADDATLDALIRNRWKQREDRYSELRGETNLKEGRVEMFRIGG